MKTGRSRLRTRRRVASTTAAAPLAPAVALEDGTSVLLLENGSRLLLE